MKYLALALLLLAALCACTAVPATPTHIPLPTLTLETGAPTAAITFVPINTLRPVPTWTAQPSLTPRPTYTDLPTLTARPTYTPYPTNTAYPTSTPRPTATIISGRIQRAHPLPIPRADGVAAVDWFEYVCFTAYFWGIADGINFWVHDDPVGYKICVDIGHAGVKRKAVKKYFSESARFK